VNVIKLYSSVGDSAIALSNVGDYNRIPADYLLRRTASTPFCRYGTNLCLMTE